MRLIDADELINIIEWNKGRKEDVFASANGFINLIKERPTAYDVDKVIKQLTVLKEHYHKCCLVDYNEGAEVGITEALAIVQAGGVE